ncbi:hypothetical protein L950_0221135 [Sphingobacterium sp. IITKGP-BTPF85]|nr:hypothetical protein L950_0221135 [Sphingobacterium sp. IITKGP-BTPF85]
MHLNLLDCANEFELNSVIRNISTVNFKEVFMPLF